MFQGVHTAIVTPFAGHGIDAHAFCTLIDRQFENGISGIVPVGTTGESPTLSHEEHVRVIELAAQHAAKRGLVIAGTGSNSTDEAITLTQAAQKAGADAVLLVAPYYNKPSQEGLYQHFKLIAEASELPIMLYSIPGRCGIAIEVETVVRLAEICPTIRAIKEAGGSAERVSQLRAALPDSFEILSGDDSLTLPFMSLGACGVVSVASNLVPRVMVDLVAAANEGRFGDALAIHRRYYPLFSAFLKLDTNPVPIKAALGLKGLCSPDLRLPMVQMPESKLAELRGILDTLGI
ncbi:MAG: 4-hydroxy-tetrahydrodipicolinate synthase [Verrucomicrobiales bacterium]|nr:4-hydroxy-tetrahydrodipicolinate synthase [Verrucomicrobiales bacterium]